MKKTLEANLRSAIHDDGRSMQGIARDAGLSGPTVTRFLSGKRVSMTLSVAQRLARTLGYRIVLEELPHGTRR